MYSFEDLIPLLIYEITNIPWLWRLLEKQDENSIEHDVGKVHLTMTKIAIGLAKWWVISVKKGEYRVY